MFEEETKERRVRLYKGKENETKMKGSKAEIEKIEREKGCSKERTSGGNIGSLNPFIH